MELTLAVFAVVALLMALGMGAVTWRLLRDERRRSEARIAALVAALEGSPGAPPSPVSPASPPADARAPGWLARVAGMGAVAGLVLAVALVTVLGLGGDGAGPETSAPAAPAPIELLALEHEPAGDMLAIRGSVRAADASVSGPLAVLATALDAAGATVARGRVDLASLAPGAVLPFAVEVPAAGTRYRISFLRAGAAVPHVDRRTSARAGAAVTEVLDGAGGAS